MMAKKLDVLSMTEKDLILTSSELWLLPFVEFRNQTIDEVGFDYLWLAKNYPGTFEAIVRKEWEIHETKEPTLSMVLKLMQEWRELVVQAQRKAL